MAVYNHVIDHKDVKKTEGSCSGDTHYVKGFLTMGCVVEFVFAKTKKLQSSSRRLLAEEFNYALTNVSVTYDTSKPPGASKGKHFVSAM